MSTYLISKAKHYRNFRLLFEMRMPVGNHSGVGFCGQQHRFEQEESTWKGHLAILPQTGIFDIYNRGWNERVKREGTTFQQIKDDRRCDVAKLYLERLELSINEVAIQMGFTDPSAFHRSFKKWTGITPGQFRVSRRRGTNEAPGSRSVL